MSATMHYSFAPNIPVSVRYGVPFDADDQALFRATHDGQNPAGTLWERVADRGTGYTAQSTRRLAGRNAGMRGTLARDYANARQFGESASGIIRAGQRA